MSDAVEEHWPHVAALHRMLTEIADHAITINASSSAQPDIPRIVEGLRQHGKREPLRLPA